MDGRRRGDTCDRRCRATKKCYGQARCPVMPRKGEREKVDVDTRVGNETLDEEKRKRTEKNRLSR